MSKCRMLSQECLCVKCAAKCQKDPFGIVKRIQEICYAQKDCFDCPLCKDKECLIVKMPFSWNTERIGEALLCR